MNIAVLKHQIEDDEDPNITVVRLKTTTWADHKGVYVRRSMTVLKRKSSGHNLFLEDALMDAEGINIVNLDECRDGIYHVGQTNISRDWETGYIESWDYVLIPHVDV